jgi:perosamine synthetase
VKAFERDFAAYVGSTHALAVNSCTAALHLGLEAVGVRPGDVVITSPMTFTATAAVIEHLGARPVLVDCEPDTLNLDPARLEAAITPRTRAILPVHFAGQACDMDAIMGIARARGLAVVEDAAHALPTRHRGRMVGTLGDITCFSFYATKTITTGEGGMAVTDREDYAERMRLMHLHGMSHDAWKRYTKNGSWAYEILAAGFKYNLTDIAASIGIAQLTRADAFHVRRLEIARAYGAGLAGLRGLRTPVARDESGHAWHLYVIQVVPEELTIDRDEVIRKLVAMNIGVSVHFIPLHQHPYYREKYEYQPGDLPVATAAARRILTLPLYPKMTDDDVQDVIDAVRSVMKENGR